MLKNSHISFGLALTPLLFIPLKYKNIVNDINFIDHIEKGYFKFLSFFSSFNFSLFYFSLLIFSVILYVIGTTLPDVDIKLKFLFSKEDRGKRFLYHRQYTHGFLVWLFILCYFLYNLSFLKISLFSNQVFIDILFISLSLGVLTHLIGDMLTGSVPWLFYGHYGKKISRIGITIFLPKTLHSFFTKELPDWLNKNLWIFGILFLINLIIFFIL